MSADVIASARLPAELPVWEQNHTPADETWLAQRMREEWFLPAPELPKGTRAHEEPLVDCGTAMKFPKYPHKVWPYGGCTAKESSYLTAVGA